MKRCCRFFLITLCLFLSCKGDPQPVQPKVEKPVAPVQQSQAKPPEPVKVPEPVKAPEPVSNHSTPAFDPSTISREEKDTTKTEIQQLIQQLDNIIRAKNYNAWVEYLDPEYFAAISSREHLDRASQSPVLVKQNIVLKSARDYFTHVVVPSRANDRVDDIEFISQNRVKAFTINNSGSRLRLYDLEKSQKGWMIIN